MNLPSSGLQWVVKPKKIRNSQEVVARDPIPIIGQLIHRNSRFIDFMTQFGRSIRLAAATLAVTLGSTSATFAQQNPETAMEGSSYPTAVTQAYLTNCVSAAENYDIPSSGANAYCNCTLDEFQSHYTLEEFMAMSAKVMQNQAPPEFTEVVNTCLPYLGQS